MRCSFLISKVGLRRIPMQPSLMVAEHFKNVCVYEQVVHGRTLSKYPLLVFLFREPINYSSVTERPDRHGHASRDQVADG